MNDHKADLQKGLAVAKAVETLSAEKLHEARIEAIRLLVGIPMGVAEAERSKALIDMAKAMWIRGQDMLEAVEASVYGVGLARNAHGDSEVVCRALLFHATLLMANSNPLDALASCNEAMAMGRKLGSRNLQAMAANNEGLIMLGVGRYDSAMHRFEEVLDHLADGASDEGSRWLRFLATANIALARWNLRDYAMGVEAAEDALELLPRTEDRQVVYHRALLLATYAKLLAAVTRYEEAERAAREAVQAADVAGAAIAKIGASCALGLIEILTGRADIGRSRVIQAVDASRQVPGLVSQTLVDGMVALERAGDTVGAYSFHMDYTLRIRRAYREADFRQIRSAPAFTDASGDSEHLEKMLGTQAASLRSALTRQVSTVSRLIGLALQAEPTMGDDCLHPFRMQVLMCLFARRLGLPDPEVEHLGYGALLHDIGMICVPYRTQFKRNLDDEERKFIKMHPSEGATILASCKEPFALVAEEMALSHHEKYDGSGYPHGLRGEGIPRSGRLCAIVDAYEVMTHDRPYAPAKLFAEAMEELPEAAGRQFDPELTSVFVDLMWDLHAQHGDVNAFLNREALAQPHATSSLLLRATPLRVLA